MKLCFGNEIHRVSKLPASISALKESINKAFEGRLSNGYTLQYFDADNDKIMLTNDEDFTAMISE